MRSGALALALVLVPCDCLLAWSPPSAAATAAAAAAAAAAKSRMTMTSAAPVFDARAGLSPLATSVEPSKTIQVHALTKEMEARGEAVVSLCVGEPDFQPPAQVLDATTAAVRAGDTKYTGVTGTMALRSAICEDLLRRKGTRYEPSQIVVGNGAKQGVYQSVLATVRPGDEVIVPAPYWPSYTEIVRMAGGEPVVVETTAEDGYLLSPEALRAAITPRTRMLIFCNPSNPTGAVHSPEQCEALAGVLREPKASKVWLLSDEIYERILYDEAHISMSSLQGMAERTIIVNGFSKSHAMTGFRVGYIAGPAPLISAVTTLQGQITSCASSIGQAAALAALQVPDSWLEESVKGLRQKRDFVLRRLAAMEPRLRLPSKPPQGAFYVLPDFSWCMGRQAPDGTKIGSPTDLCLYMLREHKLALVTGEAFGAPQGVRISYASSMEELTAAMDGLEACLLSLS
jgi:aspartate/glutamate/aspartate-prephenate aminotransferase